MRKLDWNYERWRTRDRLLEYDYSIMPPHPHSGGLPLIYPWENIGRSLLAQELYEIAKNYGFSGTQIDFFTKFSSVGGNIIRSTLREFPIPGNETNLYFDEETEILYYFKISTAPILPAVAARIGAAIIGQSVIADSQEKVTYLYIPIRALLIEDTLFNYNI